MTSTSARFNGFSWTFLSSLACRILRLKALVDGKSTAAACGKWSSSAEKIFWAACSVVWARFLMFPLIFVASYSTCDGRWVCLFFSSIKSSVGDSSNFALYWPLRRRLHSLDEFSFARIFSNTYIKSFLKSFLWPLSVYVNPISNEQNWVTFTKLCLQYEENLFQWSDVWILIIHKLSGRSKRKMSTFLCNEWVTYRFVYILRHNDTKKMTSSPPPAPCYLLHYQIFDKTDNFLKKVLHVFGIKIGKLHFGRTV